MELRGVNKDANEETIRNTIRLYTMISSFQIVYVKYQVLLLADNHRVQTSFSIVV